MEDAPPDWFDRWSKRLEKQKRQRSRTWPAGSGRLVDLPRMSETELMELLDMLERRVQTEQGCERRDPKTASIVPDFPERAHGDRLLVCR